MENKKIQKLLPYITAIVLFLVLSFAYFPEIFKGKELYQMDIANHKGIAKAIDDYRNTHNKEALWTNSLFGGMPAYLISTHYEENLVMYIHQFLFLGYNFRPVTFVFVLMLGFFIALLAFRVNPWLAIAGAIAYGFSTYFFMIIEAGHVTKTYALCYMPPIIGGVYLALSDKPKVLIGSIITAIFLSLQMRVFHYQITYYTLITIIILGVFLFVEYIKKKEYADFFKRMGILVIGVTLAIGTNTTSIILVQEYSQESTRGKTELTNTNETETSGLSVEYATAWSYGVIETFNLLVPDYMGGSSTGKLSKKSTVYKALTKKANVPKAQAQQYIQNMPTYWGEQTFTSGPVYIGAVVIFLFILGLFLVEGKIKWWLVTATAVAFILAWGKHVMPITEFLLHYLPGYNKFRVVAMALVIVQFTMPLLGILAINQLIEKKINKEAFFKAFKSTLITSGSLLIFIFITSLIVDFTSPNDTQITSQWPDFLYDALLSDRKSMLLTDLFRSIIFIGLVAASLYLFMKNKLKKNVFLISLAAFILIDLWGVNKRILSDSDFVKSQKIKEPYTASKADIEILKDNDPNYRVLNLAVNTFNDASTSYFHKSIGGYHGAKPGRYQELIEAHISPNIEKFAGVFQKKPTMQTIDSTLKQLYALNMLNTKYIIINKDAAPIPNPYAMGNAWFVKNYKIVENADEEITQLTNFSPANTAIIDKRFADKLKKLSIKPDNSASIKLTDYEINRLKYQTNTTSEQLAVFSEQYYPYGWNAFIDGKPAEYFRANYILRAMKIPPGKHEIEFRFEPSKYEIGTTISFISAIILLLALAGVIFVEYKKAQATKANQKNTSTKNKKQ